MRYLPLLLIAYNLTVHAEPYKVESRVPEIILKDQHDQTRKVEDTVQLILFCKDRKSQDIANEALESTSGAYLSTHHTVYIVDTSGMPRLIGKFIALPALRKKSYNVLLDPEPSVTKAFPSRQDHVTLLYLTNYIIKKIEFVDTSGDLKNAIDGIKPSQPIHTGGNK